MGKAEKYWEKKYKEQKEQEEFNETFSARLVLAGMIIILVLLAIFG